MSANQESGHYKNVANLKALIAFGQEFGTNFNPPGSDLQLASLQTFYNQVKAAVDAQVTAEVNLINARATRRLLFGQLKTLAGRVLNTLIACNASPDSIADVRAVANKLRLIYRKKDEVAEPPAGEEGGVENRGRSTIQSSFDARLSHFERMITLLGSNPAYQPNEQDLGIAALTAHLAALHSSNDAVVNAQVLRNSALALRNRLMYDPETGLVHKAVMIKKYIAAMYGPKSEEYRKANKLQFRSAKS